VKHLTACLATVAATLALAAASAAAISPAELARLAAQAPRDPQALAQVRAVTRVGSTRVDLATALHAHGTALLARLKLLALSLSQPAGPSTAGAQATARSILEERRFRGSEVPRPLHRPLSWLGGLLHRASAALARGYRSVAKTLPGGAPVFWTLAVLAVAALAMLVAWKLGRRRRARSASPRVPDIGTAADDPRRLERLAEEAEANGAFAEALRLRFRAGIVRLARSGAIPSRESLTNGQIESLLDSATFSRIAADFNDVVYGLGTATPEEAQRARAGWPSVLEEVRPR
jgi:hypothetical protein